MKRLALPHVPLLDAARDPALLGAGLKLWPTQIALLEGVAKNRLSVWSLGRRAGKSTSSAMALLWCCLLRPELLSRLRPGERGYAVCIATNARQARLILHAATTIVQASPVLSEMVEAVLEDELVFTNGTALAAFPCSSRAGRGWPIFGLVLDEAAHMQSETDGYMVADRVFEALVPATAQFGRDARVIVCSTPFGPDGFFADLWNRVSSGELEEAIAFQFSTSASNPTIDPGFLAQEWLRDPDGYLGEYEAQFVGSGNVYLDPARVDAAVAERGELEPSVCSRWIAGLDPAFSSDPFGLTIVGLDRDGSGRLRVGLARSWKPTRTATFEDRRAHEDQVLAEVAEIVRPYTTTLVTDQYAAAAIIDRLRREGLAVESIPMSPSSKTNAYAELRARLYTDGLELYDHPGLMAELKRLRAKYTAGQASVVNPRVNGSHGDIAQALALAVYAFDRWGVPRTNGGALTQRSEPAIVRLADLERLIGGRPIDRTRSPRWYDDADAGLRARVF